MAKKINITPAQDRWLGQIFWTPYLHEYAQQYMPMFLYELSEVGGDDDWQTKLSPPLKDAVVKSIHSAQIKHQYQLDWWDEIEPILNEREREFSSFKAWYIEGSCLQQRMASPEGEWPIPDHWHELKGLFDANFKMMGQSDDM